VTALLLDFRLDLGSRNGVAIGNDELATTGGETARNGAPKAAGAPGHDCHSSSGLRVRHGLTPAPLELEAARQPKQMAVLPA